MEETENLDSIVKLLESVKTLYMAEKSREKIFERFESVSSNIVLKLLQFKNPTVNYVFDRRKLGLTLIMFNKNSLAILKQKMEHRMEDIADKSFGTELEVAYSLVNELDISDSFIYIYSPSVIVKDTSDGVSKDKVESDFMLMAYNGKIISLKLAEIKTRVSKKNRRKNKLKTILCISLG